MICIGIGRLPRKMMTCKEAALRRRLNTPRMVKGAIVPDDTTDCAGVALTDGFKPRMVAEGCRTAMKQVKKS